MLSGHSRNQISVPPPIIMLAKDGLVPTGHRAPDPDLTTGARGQ
ncbi:hypothetical protein EIO_3263 (plasmid) [Ketogulonicigenium vulgare Y25]|uniref:Uncharacterized protein n=1 Tax=Ketogulonicigenium vulgare (strain WSH-001) TaxID=759362 RepID=F9YBK1_KETVW|nr:hypothetical protein EIO_3263 [Ketogulonicigenium vulgare Y25]AEM42753.1 hypothetical protein KVU_PB0075 [Ketogulonicigenium vulgare WSH-001]ALJ82802.1 hypothetical protein KVH_15995 [Ketogulonicigenium vulgare]